MVVNVKSFFGSNVRTQSGLRLGQVQTMSLDQDTGKLALIHVRARGVTHLLENESLISWTDIISMSVEEIIVRDGVIPIRSASVASEASHPTTS